MALVGEDTGLGGCLGVQAWGLCPVPREARSSWRGAATWPCPWTLGEHLGLPQGQGKPLLPQPTGLPSRPGPDHPAVSGGCAGLGSRLGPRLAPPLPAMGTRLPVPTAFKGAPGGPLPFISWVGAGAPATSQLLPTGMPRGPSSLPAWALPTWVQGRWRGASVPAGPGGCFQGPLPAQLLLGLLWEALPGFHSLVHRGAVSCAPLGGTQPASASLPGLPGPVPGQVVTLGSSTASFEHVWGLVL